MPQLLTEDTSPDDQDVPGDGTALFEYQVAVHHHQVPLYLPGDGEGTPEGAHVPRDDTGGGDPRPAAELNGAGIVEKVDDILLHPAG